MKQHTRALIHAIRQTVGEPQTGVEVGVWRGHNSAGLLRAFPGLQLTGVDQYSPGYDGTLGTRDLEEFVAAWREASSVTAFAGRRFTLAIGASLLWAEMLSDRSFDFVFLDGDHSYDAVRADIAAWLPRVRPGGLLAGHDYGGKGDRTGQFGVRRAVDEAFGATIGRAKRALVWWKVME